MFPILSVFFSYPLKSNCYRLQAKEKSTELIIEADNEQAKWFREDTKKFNKQELKKLIDQKYRNVEHAKAVKAQFEFGY